jgi:hypothetical protein
MIPANDAHAGSIFGNHGERSGGVIRTGANALLATFEI